MVSILVNLNSGSSKCEICTKTLKQVGGRRYPRIKPTEVLAIVPSYNAPREGEPYGVLTHYHVDTMKNYFSIPAKQVLELTTGLSPEQRTVLSAAENMLDALFEGRHEDAKKAAAYIGRLAAEMPTKVAKVVE